LSDIKSFKTTQIYTQKIKNGPIEFINIDDICSICLEEYKPLNKLEYDDDGMKVDLSCDHIFHKGCVEKLCNRNLDSGSYCEVEFAIKCPLCRKECFETIMPIEYVFKKGIHINKGVMRIERSPIFEYSSAHYNKYVSANPLWWEILTVS